MAANEITFKVKVTKDGSLKVVAKDADKAAKGTEKLGKATDETTKARNRYSRGEKGVAQAGMNSTKAFSKMRDVMGGGSSGLVGAYATLAANVFALTAAFGILQRASAAEQLAEGLEFTGTVAGRNLPFIADRLKEITGAAVSTQEAMSAVALATSSGFSSQQIAELGEVAKGASLALGRDMTDALNRLVRGAAKLEPELLDELGIMVRLDDATRQYADQLGTVEGNLTQYQKRQAFVNAIIREGQNSFSGIAAAIEPNVYDQLSAALSDLLKDFVTLLNKGLQPVVKLFSKSPTALVGGILLFASTIRGQLLPGLTQGAQRMANFAAESKMAAQASFANVSTTGALPKVYTELASKIQNGTATTEDFNKAQSSLNNSMAKHNRDLEKNSALQDTSTKKGAEKAAKIDQVRTAQAKLNNITVLGAKADTAAAKATAINAAAQMQFGGTIKGIRAAMAAYKVEITATAIANGAATASFAGLRVALFGAATGFAALATGILTLMPFLAAIPLVIGLGKTAFDKFFGDSGTSSKIEEITDSLDHLTKVSSQLNVTLEQIELRDAPDAEYQKFLATLRASAGAAAQIRDRTVEIVSAQTTAQQEALTQAILEQVEAQKAVEEGHFFKGPRTLANNLEAATNRVNELKDSFNQVELEPIIRNLRVANELLGDTDADGTLKAANEERIKDLQKLSVEGKAAAADVLEVLAPRTIPEGTDELLNSLNGSLTKFSESLNKMRAKVATPFDEMKDALDDAVKSISQVDEKTGKATISSAKLAEAMKDPSSSLSKAMKEFGIEADNVSEDTLKRISNELNTQIEILQKAPGEVKRQEAELKKLAVARKDNADVARKALELEDSILFTKLSELQAQEQIFETFNSTEEKSAQLLEIESQKAALIEAIKNNAQRNLEIVSAEVAESRKLLKIDQQRTEILKDNISRTEKGMRRQFQAENFADPNIRDPRITAKQEREIQKAIAEERRKVAENEAVMAATRIDNEYKLLQAKAELEEKLLASRGIDTEQIKAYRDTLETMRTAGIENIIKNYNEAIAEIGDTTLSDAAVRDAAQAAFAQGSTVGERFYSGFYGANAAFDELNTAEKFKAIHTAMQPMIEDFRNLGPGGEHISAAINGIAMMTQQFIMMGQTIADFSKGSQAQFEGMFDSFSNFTEALKNPEIAQGLGQFMSGIASGVGALASTFAAASANRIAGIDAEIAAEKKRDGQSAQSVAKIQALEKKKEEQKRKAFEIDKKLKMAQIVINTAAAMMMTLGQTGFFGFSLTPIIAAFGAAQLAMVASMSYAGGGGSAGASTPSSVSIGSRRDSVDLSRSQSARGELAYMRGDQGIGGPENFRPAFYGKKNRNMGGATGYVVGEQGPELFMPDRPGTIVPADDTAAVGGNTNVTFTINAIDASGVEEVLAQQQGNIIGMIRNAANSYGEDFLEDLDESTYTSPVARRA